MNDIYNEINPLFCRGTHLLIYFLHPLVAGAHMALNDVTHVEYSKQVMPRLTGWKMWFRTLFFIHFPMKVYSFGLSGADFTYGDVNCQHNLICRALLLLCIFIGSPRTNK